MEPVKKFAEFINEAKKSLSVDKKQNFVAKGKYSKEVEMKGDVITLYHYSDLNVKVLDPENFGKNLYTRTEQRTWGRPRLFFYTKPSGKDADVIGDKKYLYICEVDATKLYPVHQDPLKYGEKVDDVIPEYYMNSIYEKYHILAEQDGYIGFIYKNLTSPTVVIWEEVKPVKKIKLDK